MRFWLAGIAALLGGAGCSVIDADISNFTLRLPSREVVVDSAAWELTDEHQTLPAVPCQSNAVCVTGIAPLCAADEVCFGQCDGQNCRVIIDITLWNAFDLEEEAPELEEIGERPLGKVSVSRVEVDIIENSLNVGTPSLGLYVAPQTVMEPSDERAVLFGTMSMVAAGATPAAIDVELDPEGKTALEAAMRDYRTPFNVVVAGQLTVDAFTPVPSGRLVANVQVTASAGI